MKLWNLNHYSISFRNLFPFVDSNPDQVNTNDIFQACKGLFTNYSRLWNKCSPWNNRSPPLHITILIQYYPDLCYHCVLKKCSVSRNSLTRGLFFVVNVLRSFKIAQLRKQRRTFTTKNKPRVKFFFSPSYAISSFSPPN